ncbi:serine hydrolase [Nocardioides mangrovicus]|uniref:serine hydrolase n=1 Tax=Nocardioides mangrovicus TaxID=2478913 RepID=UPI0013143EC2|nr:serine hydrolase [Nocardioides mangrovicus]
MSAREQIAGLASAYDACVSVHLASLEGRTLLSVGADEPHPAASTFKVALVEALHRRGDLEEEVEVRAVLPSLDGGTFETTEDYDNDPLPWQRLGRTASLAWLAERAIVRSSNLATNLLLETVGIDAVNAVYSGTGCRVERPIQDPAAGRANVVTARGLTTVLGTVDRRVLGLMAACEDAGMAPGLPADAALAHKPGWFEGVCHDHGTVRPASGEPRVLAVLTRADLPGEQHVELLAQVAAAAWSAA